MYPDGTNGHLEGLDKWPALGYFCWYLGVISHSALTFFAGKLLNPFDSEPTEEGSEYFRTHNFPGAFTPEILRKWYSPMGFWTVSAIHSGNLVRVSLMAAEAVMRGDAMGKVATVNGRTRVDVDGAVMVDAKDFNSSLLMNVDREGRLRVAVNWFKAAVPEGGDLTRVDVMQPVLPLAEDLLRGVEGEAAVEAPSSRENATYSSSPAALVVFSGPWVALAGAVEDPWSSEELSKRRAVAVDGPPPTKAAGE